MNLPRGLRGPLRSLTRMSWRRIVMAHWPVEEPELIERRLPPGVELDAFWGRPWKSLVAFEVTGPAPLPLHAWPVRRAFTCVQVDLRTYVRGPLGPGVVLLDTAVDRQLALGPRLLGLPYEVDESISLETRGDIEVRSAHELVRGRVEDPAWTPRTGTIDDFLLERYAVYSRGADGTALAVRIEHPPWEVHPATLSAPLRGDAELGHFSELVRGVRVVETRRLTAPAASAGSASRAA